MTTIRRDEWLKALMDATGDPFTDDPEAVTVKEFGEMFGMKRETARRHLEVMVKLGTAVRSQRRIAVVGRVMTVSGYRLVPQKGGRKKKAA